jgi:hypothetical protein
MEFFAGAFRWYITWRRLVKNLTPQEEKSAGLNNIVWRITKALGPWILNVKFEKTIDVHECSKSSPDDVATL